MRAGGGHAIYHTSTAIHPLWEPPRHKILSESSAAMRVKLKLSGNARDVLAAQLLRMRAGGGHVIYHTPLRFTYSGNHFKKATSSRIILYKTKSVIISN
jgi:hypothetical protein